MLPIAKVWSIQVRPFLLQLRADIPLRKRVVRKHAIVHCSLLSLCYHLLYPLVLRKGSVQVLPTSMTRRLHLSESLLQPQVLLVDLLELIHSHYQVQSSSHLASRKAWLLVAYDAAVGCLHLSHLVGVAGSLYYSVPWLYLCDPFVQSLVLVDEAKRLFNALSRTDTDILVSWLHDGLFTGLPTRTWSVRIPLTSLNWTAICSIVNVNKVSEVYAVAQLGGKPV